VDLRTPRAPAATAASTTGGCGIGSFSGSLKRHRSCVALCRASLRALAAPWRSVARPDRGLGRADRHRNERFRLTRTGAASSTPETLPKGEYLAYYARHFLCWSSTSATTAMPDGAISPHRWRARGKGHLTSRPTAAYPRACGDGPDLQAFIRRCQGPSREAGRSARCWSVPFNFLFGQTEENRATSRTSRNPQARAGRWPSELRREEWPTTWILRLVPLGIAYACVDEAADRGAHPPIAEPRPPRSHMCRSCLSALLHWTEYRTCCRLHRQWVHGHDTKPARLNAR